MPFEPNKITAEHVLKAAEAIDLSDAVKPSTRYDVIINGKAYPPKEVMRYAHQVMNGESIWRLRGGASTNDLLRALGYEVVTKDNNMIDPLLDIINRYKEFIKVNGISEEIYKWRLIKKFGEEFDLNAEDFYSMVKSLDFYNLVFQNSRMVLNQLAEKKPIETKQLFERLYDETIPLDDRISKFRKGAEDIYSEIKAKSEHSAYQDERAIATYLAFRYPDKYILYKESFYSQLCEVLNIEKAEVGQKYLHYLSIVNEIREDYVQGDKELVELVSNLLTGDCYKDPNSTVLTQDILYAVLDKAGKKKRFWRILSRFGPLNLWEEMRDNEFIAIGWSQLGNLNGMEGLSKSKIIEEFESVLKDDKRSATRKAGEVVLFYDEIAIDDYVVVCDGKRVLGVGIVTGQYYYQADVQYKHRRPVKWLFTDIKDKQIDEGLRTSVSRLYQYNSVKTVESILSSVAIPVIKHKASMALNTILFGPPGTGKTYSTIHQAATIAISVQFDSHDEAKRAFDHLRKEGQIEFITFHQNYGYEDFMIGIKPQLDGSELGFRRHEGVFYRICKKAEENYLQHITGKTYVEPTFEDVLEEFLAPLVDQEIELETEARGYPFSITANNGKNLSFRKKSGGTGHTISISTLKELFEDRKELNSQGQGIWIYYKPIISALREMAKKMRKETGKVELKNYVLIIDEINRANISKVFGELITLLEEDKRIGSSNELRVSLPNGDKAFGVPPNLFLLGTMNTADKSIAHIDIALRRRFEFIAKYPEPSLLPEPFKALLIALNKGIMSYKKSPDFMIGHAFFMNEEKEALNRILRNKILPLLNEYFMGRSDIIKEILDQAGLNAVFNSNTQQIDLIDAVM